MKACVMMIRAAFTLFSDSRMLAMTEAPIPNISPMPVMTIKTGATIFTAAIPSVPTPRPTKMPSMTVNAELKIIPTIVGKNNERNIGPILSFAKSSLSLFKFLSFFIC